MNWLREWTAVLFVRANFKTNSAVQMKKRNRSKREPLKKSKRTGVKWVAPPRRKPPIKKKPAKARRVARPRAVQLAIRRLLDTTNHIQARAAELENALDALRELERGKAVKDLLLALRNSADGDLLRSNPAAPSDGGNIHASPSWTTIRTRLLPILQCGKPCAIRLSTWRGEKSQRSPKPRLSVISLANLLSVAVSGANELSFSTHQESFVALRHAIR